MNDEQIFELAEKLGFQDDYGRWNFNNDGLLDFVFEVQKAFAEPANSTTDFVEPKASSQTEQEPVCFLRETSWSYEIAPWDDPNGIPVYIAPPKREWVGLTREDKDDLVHALPDIYSMEHVILATEAKLKEKNTCLGVRL
jgi:hypothetical protein